MQPLDHPTATGRIGAARLFSHVISPPVIFAALGFAVAQAAAPGWAGFGWGVLYGVLVALAPILYVVFLLQTGRISDISMTRRERRIPYIVGTITSAVALGTFVLLGAPELLRCLALFNVLALGTLGAVNWFWQISHHATAITSATVIAGAVFGQTVGWALLPLMLLVIGVRLYLRRHTPGQLVAGALVGSGYALLLIVTGCF